VVEHAGACGGREANTVMRQLVLVALIAISTVALAACEWTPLSVHRWQCGSHTYYINADGAPTGAVAMIKNAFAQVNAITAPRLVFDYGGTTTATTGQTGEIIVRWTTIGGGDYGDGAPQPWPDGPTFTGGYIELDKTYPANQGLALHEVGHVLSLGHVNEAGEVMQPDFIDIRSLSSYGPGDVAGLTTQAEQCLS